MGGELIRRGTPAVLLLGLLKSSADVLRPVSSLVRFPHMASYSAWQKSRSGTDSFSVKHITLSSHERFPFLSLCQFSLSLALFSLCFLSLCLSPSVSVALSSSVFLSAPSLFPLSISVSFSPPSAPLPPILPFFLLHGPLYLP